MIKTIPSREPGEIFRWSVEVFALRDGRYEAVGRFEAVAPARSALLDGFEADLAAIFG